MFDRSFLKRLTLFVTLIMAFDVICVWANPLIAQTVPTSFNYFLLIPYVLGVLVHWVTMYQQGHVTANFLTWVFSDISKTVISLVVGIGTTVGNYNLNPEAYAGISGYITVFMFAIAADTVNGTKGQSVQPPPQG